MNITQLTEQAIATYLTRQNLETIPVGQIYKGIENNGEDDPTRKIPNVTIICLGLSEFIPLTGIFRGNVEIQVVHSSFDVTDEAFDLICQEVFGCFNWDDLDTRLTDSKPGFTCQMANLTGANEAVRDGANWVSSIILDVVVCASDL